MSDDSLLEFFEKLSEPDIFEFFDNISDPTEDNLNRTIPDYLLDNMSTIEELKAKRTGQKGACTKTASRLKPEPGSDAPDRHTIAAIIDAVHERLGNIAELNAKISLNMTDPSDIENDGDTEDFYKIKIYTMIKIAEDGLLKSDAVSNASACTHHAHSGSNTVKLPVIKVPTFDNTIKNWKSFWDSYCAAVDHNQSLSNVQKLTYLRSYLQGEASDLVKQLPLEDASYTITISVLKETFENPLLVALDLVRRLDGIAKIKHEQLSLRSFRAEFESLLGGIGNQGFPLEGSKGAEMLVTGLMLTRMPPSLLSTMLRVDKSTILTLEGFKSALNQEIDQLISEGVLQEPITKKAQYSNKTVLHSSPIRTRSIADNFHVGYQAGHKTQTQQKSYNRNQQAYKPTEGKSYGKSWNSQSSARPYYEQDYNSQRYNSQNYRYQNNRKQFGSRSNGTKPKGNVDCMLCNNNHYPSKCDTYTTVIDRKNRLKVLGKCIHCLKKYPHPNGQCAPDISCRECNEPHAFTVCPQACKKGRNTTISFPNTVQVTAAQVGVLNRDESVVLPFLQLPVQGPTTSSSNTCQYVNTLLDQGSQKTFILRRTAEQLGLKTIEHQMMIINTLTGRQPEQNYEVVDIPIQTLKGDIMMKGVVVDTLPTQRYEQGIVKKLVQISKRFKLADCDLSNNGNVNFELLVGADYYWDIVTNDSPINAGEDYRLIPTIFGYVLSGKLTMPTTRIDTTFQANVLHL